MASDDPYAGFDTPALAPNQIDESDPYAGFAKPAVLPRAIGSVGSNGQQAGESLSLSKKSGIPGVVIDADLPGAKQDIGQRTASTIVAANPTIQRYLEADPLHAKISHDDYENLQRATETAKNLTDESLLSRLWKATKAGAYAGTPEETPQWLQEIQQLPTSETHPYLTHALKNFVYGVGLAGQAAQGVIGTGIGALQGFGAQLAQEDPGMGYPKMSEAWANRLNRDIGIIAQGALVEPMFAPSVPREMQAAAKAAAKPESTIRPESAAMLDHGITPPPGFDPVVDEVHGQQAKLDSINLDRMIEDRDRTETHGRSKDASQSFNTIATNDQTIGIPADAIADLYASEKKYPSPDDGLLGWIPDLEAKVKDAQQTGGDVEVSLGGYVARIDSSVHTKLQDFLRLRRDGVSLAEAKDLKETTPTEEPGFDVYHGSPHQFEQFDVGKIGTGEGAQTYGHGLYFAENRKVAEEYQRRLALEDQTGHIYQTRILAKPEDFLDLDKWLSEQTPEIQAKLKEAMGEKKWEEFQHAGAKTAIENGFIGFTPESTSAKLKEAGIPGSKYLDSGSRETARMDELNREMLKNPDLDLPQHQRDLITRELADFEKRRLTRNFVLFHDDLARIKAVNDSPVASAVAKVAEIQSEALHLNPIFTDAKAAGMTEPEFAAYNKKIEARQTAIDEKAISAASKEIKRRQSAEWKANEAEIKNVVQTETKYNPIIMADTYFRTGKHPDPLVPANIKISSDYKRSGLPKEMFAKDGVNPDDAAPLFQFNSGAAMLNQLGTLNKARNKTKLIPEEHLKRLIDEETARRMEARYGNLDENIRREAEEAVLGNQQMDILATELRALAKQNGVETPLARADVQRMINNKFEGTAVRDINSARMQRELMQAGREIERALLKGKIDDAFKWAQRRLLAFGLAKQAIAFDKFKASAERTFGQFASEANIPSVAQPFTDQIHRLLQQVGIDIKRDPTNLSAALKGKSLDDFIKTQAGEFGEGQIIIPPDLPAKNSYSDFTVGEFRDLVNSIDSLEHAGRDVKKIEVGQKKEAYENVIGNIAKNLDTLEKKDFDPVVKGIIGKTRRAARNIDARLIKMEQLFDWADKNDPLGDLNQSVYRKLYEGENAKADMIGELAKDVRNLPVDRAWGRALADVVDNQILKDADGNVMRLTNENKIAIALNSGNASNLSVLTRGMGWTEAEVKAFLDKHMTEMDIKFVQGVWDMFAKLAPLVEGLTERRTGVSVPMVEKVPLELTNGKASGGYYPLVKDPRAVLLGYERTTEMADKPYFDPLPMARALKARTGVAYPLDLTINSIHNRINETAHAVFLQEAVANANKVLSDPIVKQGFDKAFGPEYVEQFKPWLHDIANNGGAQSDVMANWASRNMRENVVAMLMGWRVSTAAIHGGSAAAASAYEIGPLQLIKNMKDLGMGQFLPDAARRFFANEEQMKSLSEWALANSPELRNRQRSMQRDFGAQMSKVVSQGFVDDAARVRALHIQWSMAMVAYIDQLTATPVFMSKYKEARVDGLGHDDAVFVADKAVRQAHGSASLVNRANIGRGEVNRWLTVAYNGYWNHNYNRTRSAVRDIANDELDTSDRFIKGAAAATALIVAPAIVHQVIRGNQNESWQGAAAEATVSQFGGQVPVVNALTYSLLHGRDPSLSPFDDFFKGALATAVDAKRMINGKKAEKAVKHAIETPGWLFGLGATQQLGTAVQYGFDVGKRKENPNGSVLKWGQGLLTGTSKEKRR